MTAENTQKRIPVVTTIVFIVTMTVTSLQFIFPAILTELRRSPEMYSSGEWWRFITPLFVHTEGWPQIVFNGLCLAILGPVVERYYGPYRWLALYFLSGFVGEVAGLAWKPTGAGASVACCGLLGGLAIWRLLRDRTQRGRLVGGGVLAFAVSLTAIHDLHGPPILAGMFLALLMIKFQVPISASQENGEGSVQ